MVFDPSKTPIWLNDRPKLGRILKSVRPETFKRALFSHYPAQFGTVEGGSG